MRHDRIIDLFGGNTALGKLVNRSDSAVSRWRDNGIPPNIWPMIAMLARQRGIRGASIESLTAGPPTMTLQYRSRRVASESAP